MSISTAHQDIISKYMNNPPVRVAALANELGLRVVKSAMPVNLSGSIEPDPENPSSYLIRVNRFDSDERQRFTIAHEIAHFLLHERLIRGGIVDSILYRSNLSSVYETEANKLAADILMPYSSVNAALAEVGNVRSDENARRLAQKFKVSLSAMKIRIGIPG